MAKVRIHHLYLVTDVDVPWEKDQVRYLPEERKNFFQSCINKLESEHCNYVIINGTWEERLEKAIQSVKKLLSE